MLFFSIRDILQEEIISNSEGRLIAERDLRELSEKNPDSSEINYALCLKLFANGNFEDAEQHAKKAFEINIKEEKYWITYIGLLIVNKKVNLAYKLLKGAQNRGFDKTKIEYIQKEINQIKYIDLELAEGIEEAETLKESGNYVDTLNLLTHLDRKYPNIAEVKAQIAHILILMNEDAKADYFIKRSAEIGPSIELVKRNQVRLALKISQNELALKISSELFKTNPRNIENALIFSSSLIANKRYNHAAPILDDILKIKPNYAEALATRSMLKLYQNDLQGAIKDAIAALDLKPHLDRLWVMTGSIAQQLNDWKLADLSFQKAFELDPLNTTYIAYLGDVKRQIGDLSKAKMLYQRLLDLDKNNCNAYINLGLVYQSLGNFQEAIASYNNALEINKNTPEVYSNLALIMASKGDLGKAKQYYEKAIHIKPDFAAAYNNLGAILRELKQFEEAEYYFRKAIALNKTLGEAYSNLGNMLNDFGKYSEAQTYHRAATLLMPASAEAYCNLGATFASLGDLENAMQSYRRAIELDKYYATPYNNLGNLFFKLHNLQEAEKCYLQAIAVKSDFAEAFNSLGNLYYRNNNLEQAEVFYKKAIQLKPDYPEGYRDLIYYFLESGHFENSINYLKEGLIYCSSNNLPVISVGLVVFWLCGYKYDAKHLSNIFKEKDVSKIPRTLKTDRIYAQFMVALIDHSKDFEKLSLPKDPESELFVIGESHCLPLNNLKINWAFSNFCDVKSLFLRGVKMHHLKTHKNNYYAMRIRSYLDRLNTSCHLLITIGEIDCRPDEGIWNAYKTKKLSLENTLKITVTEYLEWLKLELKAKNFNTITIQGIPAPNYLTSFPEMPDVKIFLNMISQVNQCLKEGALSNGWRFLDVYAATVAADGASNKIWHLDGYHLKSEFYHNSSDWISVP